MDRLCESRQEKKKENKEKMASLFICTYAFIYIKKMLTEREMREKVMNESNIIFIFYNKIFRMCIICIETSTNKSE